ncbi:unnamed protein product, partial [Ixodes persulcatus]
MPPRRNQNGRRHPGGRPSTSRDTGGASRANSQGGQPFQRRTSPPNPPGGQPVRQVTGQTDDRQGGQPVRQRTGQTNRQGGQPGWRRTRRTNQQGGQPGWQRRGDQPWPRSHQQRQGGGDGEHRRASSDQAGRRDSTPRGEAVSTAAGESARRKPPRHTVATWTAQDGQEAVHFVSRVRWRNQPRPNPSQLPAQIPQPFRGHTLPRFSLPDDHPDACWLCQVPVVHQDTHEASRRHTDLLKNMGRPAGVAAAVQLLRRDRPDLLAPAALGFSQATGSRSPAPDQLLVDGAAAENPALGPFSEHTPVPLVPAPRSTTVAPSASTTTSDAEMNDLEEYLANNPATPDVTDGPDSFVDGAAAEDPALGLFPEHALVPPVPAPRSAAAAPSASATTSDAEMGELEECLAAAPGT